MRHDTGSFNGLGGITIFTRQWLPDGSPRAAVLLVHGYGEHSGRYDHVARALVERDYAVYALDHRGHGQSGGKRVQINAIDEYVADLRTCFEQVRTADGALPFFLYGHSMGSVISLRFALRYQSELAGLITTGTAFKFAGANPVTIPLIRGLGRVFPNARLIPLGANGISRDPEVVRRYREDPLVVLGLLRVGLVAELQRAAATIIEQLPTLRLPYLALHGGADPICLPVAAEIIRQRSGSPDTTVKVYEGLYHEVHNEPEQEQVLHDIGDWLDAHVP